MKLNLFRSLWGIEGAENAENWERIFRTLKDLGCDGIECSLGDIAGREAIFLELLKKVRLSPRSLPETARQLTSAPKS